MKDFLCNSRAIMQYMVNKYAPDSYLYPKDPKQKAIVDRLLYFDMGTMFKSMREVYYPQVFKGEVPDQEKEQNFKTALGYLEGYLEKSTYVAGDKLTLADISIIASLSMMDVLDYEYGSYPKISVWMAKVKEEIPDYKTTNDEPIQAFKAWVKSKQT
ncbi:glutathione S-transferase 1-like [Limulus polyphemus]|uniref:Glutathione S-transferase 1-like n=1 Tax=Limulus polyphemus TaxID=6850 RepID=A0ABM1BM95_LIMPO|nr:glutathione S-transferase 1-like [Limulus polyphemus]